MSNELLTRQQLASKLQVKPVTIIRWEKKGLPVLHINAKTIRYDYDEVRKWIDETQKKGGE